MTLSPLIRFSLVLSLMGCVTSGTSDSKQGSDQNFRRELWLEDFEQLKQFMSEGYPNLEWQRDSLKLDLPALSQKTIAELNGAASRSQAEQILSRFLETFHDSHLRLDLKPSTIPLVKRFKRDETAADVCQAMGMRNKDNSYRFTPSANFKKISTPDNPFRFGTIQTSQGVVGVLRIPSFVVHDYASVCLEEWDRYKLKIRDVCTGDCVEDFSEVMGNRLIREVEKTVMALKTQNMDILLLDLSHNGGGTDWEVGVRNMLTPKDLKCGKRGFIRHPHWASRFEKELIELDARRVKVKTEEEGRNLEKRIAEIEANLREAKSTCDRSQVWVDANFKPKCSLVVQESDSCHAPDGYRYNQGFYDGTIFVLVDSFTASASEDLAARYQDNHIATIIGEKTLGAGCGFTNGGISYKLKNSDITVKISDCVRYRLNGDNEVSGIVPDIALDMKNVKEPKFFDTLIQQVLLKP